MIKKEPVWILFVFIIIWGGVRWCATLNMKRNTSTRPCYYSSNLPKVVNFLLCCCCNLVAFEASWAVPQDCQNLQNFLEGCRPSSGWTHRFGKAPIRWIYYIFKHLSSKLDCLQLRLHRAGFWGGSWKQIFKIFWGGLGRPPQKQIEEAATPPKKKLEDRVNT